MKLNTEKFHITCVFLLFITVATKGQTISGSLVDSLTSEPLPFANVYLNNTTIGAVTDTHGYFTLKNLPAGTHDLIISFVGYRSLRLNLVLGATDLSMGTLRLLPSESELSSVEVKGTVDREWEKQLARFKRTFLGVGKEARGSVILNPWVIDFTEDRLQGRLMARSSDPIEIENRSLGYKVYYDLRDFWVSGNYLTGQTESAYSFRGYSRFEPLASAEERTVAQWEKNRKRLYQHSYSYFFKSILDRRMNGNGFKVYVTNEKSVSRLDSSQLSAFPDSESSYRVVFHGLMEISNRSKSSKLTSQIKVRNDTVRFNRMGFPLNPEDIIVFGDWNSHRVSSLLPSDYGQETSSGNDIVMLSRPNDKVKISLNDVWWYEKLYVQTDKPYYYPGEPLWFKGTIQYASPNVRDSLSKVVYVELINSHGEIIHSKTLEIDSGFFNNNFILPDSLKAGYCYLRVYTNLSRNFGAHGQFLKPFQLLATTNKVDPGEEVIETPTDSSLTLVANKRKYRQRERIDLSLVVKDEYGHPVGANLAVSVTDMRQVVPVKEKTTIVTELLRSDSIQSTALQLRYPVERGLNYYGDFRNNRGNLQATSLDVMQWQPPSLMLIDTDSAGRFVLRGLSFRDTATIAFKPTKSKSNLTGKVQIFPREVPEFFRPKENIPVKILTTVIPQRFISEYEIPRDSKLLEEVEVRAKRIDPLESVKRRADFVLEMKDIKNQNQDISTALMGSVPGLSVQLAGSNKMNVTQGGFESLIQITEPVITYFKRPVGLPTAMQVSEVESVLFIRGTSYRPANIILIPKPGFGYLRKDPDFQSVKLSGYANLTSFSAPDYSSPSTEIDRVDYRATLYWNPSIRVESNTGTAALSFWSADISTTYRIVVEGLTQNGVPVRSVYFIEVDND